jgi:hypothetical protein
MKNPYQQAAVFAQQVGRGPQHCVVIDKALPQRGVVLFLGKQPAKVLLQPAGEVLSQFVFVGGGLRLLRLAFKDALAQGVVQVAGSAGLVVFANLYLAQAVGGSGDE